MKKFFHTLTILCCAASVFSQSGRPTANPDFFFGLEDFNILIRPLDNDSDPNGLPLTWSPVTQPLNGSLIQSGGNTFYRGNQNYNGFDFFLYRACNTNNQCAFSLVTITIAPVNDRPVAVNDTFVILEDQILTGNVLLNDFDVDGDPLKTNVTQNPFNGSVVMDSVGNFTYKPNKNYHGRDEFSYRVCDTARFLNCANARVIITILPVNDAPEVVDVTLNVAEGSGSYTYNLSEVVFDPEKDTISYFVASQPTNPGVQVEINQESGWVNITLPEGFCGRDSFLYAACDYELCDTATFVLVAPQCNYQIELTEGFSPNGDGINDMLVFKFLEQFQPASLTVINRNGNMVYENEDYQNDWDGRALQTNQPLPDGTYYYILELSNGGGKHANFLVINR